MAISLRSHFKWNMLAFSSFGLLLPIWVPLYLYSSAFLNHTPKKSFLNQNCYSVISKQRFPFKSYIPFENKVNVVPSKFSEVKNTVHWAGLHDSSHKLALLIDADNTTPRVMDELIHEISKFGSVKIKRIYGDWSSPNLSSWRTKVMNHGLVPIQQMAYTPGKGNTDSALIIDCMDIFYTEDVTGFCLVSSDSDFTRLALRMREGGKLVLGVGRKLTPKAFVSACDRFIYVENLQVTSDTDVDQQTKQRRQTKMKQLTRLLLSAADDTCGNDGWSYLGNVGETLYRVKPDFDPRDYGYKKLYDLIRASKLFDLEKTVHEIKLKPKSETTDESEPMSEEDTNPEENQISKGDLSSVDKKYSFLISSSGDNNGKPRSNEPISHQQVYKNETQSESDFLI